MAASPPHLPSGVNIMIRLLLWHWPTTRGRPGQGDGCNSFSLIITERLNIIGTLNNIVMLNLCVLATRTKRADSLYPQHVTLHTDNSINVIIIIIIINIHIISPVTSQFDCFSL